MRAHHPHTPYIGDEFNQVGDGVFARGIGHLKVITQVDKAHGSYATHPCRNETDARGSAQGIDAQLFFGRGLRQHDDLELFGRQQGGIERCLDHVDLDVAV